MNGSTALNLLALASSTGGAPALALLAMETEEDSGIVDKPGLPCWWQVMCQGWDDGKFDSQRKIYSSTILNLPIESLDQWAPAVVLAQEGPALDLFAFFERVFMDGVDGELTAWDFVRFMGWDGDDREEGETWGGESSQSPVPATSEEAATTESEPSLAFTVENEGQRPW